MIPTNGTLIRWAGGFMPYAGLRNVIFLMPLAKAYDIVAGGIA